MNLLSDIPSQLPDEIFEDLVATPNVRIERILSKGHSSPEQGWYDQSENEWVMVLQGTGTLVFEDGRQIVLNTGDYINIPAHDKHKVASTDEEQVTVWLAVFY
ncbi:cupin domain-containing protein [Vibrio makurazakiensis]|uniref:cupin domain-containing protein n=1 Tax=Vibrio makurazakiensis TaxID=2910250 RepID=UPI003D0F7B7F